MNNQKKERQVNDYVLLFSAGAALGTIFLWGASYIFPEGEIVEIIERNKTQFVGVVEFSEKAAFVLINFSVIFFISNNKSSTKIYKLKINFCFFNYFL